MQMRVPDAYAYESAKYLADARACAKLSCVSPGGQCKETKRESAALAAGSQCSGPVTAIRLSADRVKSVRRRETMQDIQNGISAAQLDGAIWRKSQRSNSQGACVELARGLAGVEGAAPPHDTSATATRYIPCPSTVCSLVKGGAGLMALFLMKFWHAPHPADSIAPPAPYHTAHLDDDYAAAGQVTAAWKVHPRGDACPPAYSVGGRT